MAVDNESDNEMRRAYFYAAAIKAGFAIEQIEFMLSWLSPYWHEHQGDVEYVRYA